MNQSKQLLERAKQYQEVNSPVRAFNAVEGDPPFIKRAHGCWMYDEDDKRIWI